MLIQTEMSSSALTMSAIMMGFQWKMHKLSVAKLTTRRQMTSDNRIPTWNIQRVMNLPVFSSLLLFFRCCSSFFCCIACRQVNVLRASKTDCSAEQDFCKHWRSSRKVEVVSLQSKIEMLKGKVNSLIYSLNLWDALCTAFAKLCVV